MSAAAGCALYAKLGDAMPRFFVEPVSGELVTVTGQDANHIKKALRMRVGENLTLCDGEGTDYFCELTDLSGDEVLARILYRTPSACEPTVAVTLYQGLPKGDKLEWIVQKAVELGVTAIVPVETARSIARIDNKADKKQARLQKIADEAAGQSGRGILPRVEMPMTFREALTHVQQSGAPVLTLYEGGGEPISRLVTRETKAVSVFIGPEGGIEAAEIDALKALGASVATLGPRILRCETAPLAALSVIMALTGNMD